MATVQGDRISTARVGVPSIPRLDTAPDHVDRREEHLAETAAPHVSKEDSVDRADEALVAGVRGRRPRQLPVVDLVPPPVVRELAVVAIRQENRPIGHTEL